MNMIEVDPKLFITCRLCVEDTGVYQIMPEVQKKIKYCFDLDISLLDGLPPLICKKCESMLSHHAQIKEMLHEKQRNLVKKFKESPKTGNVIEEETSELPTVKQINIQNKDDKSNNKNSLNKKKSFKNRKRKLNNEGNSSVDKSSSLVDDIEPVTQKKENKSSKKGWRKDYKRHFVCRFCSISLKHKKSMIFHGERCVLVQKYADVYKCCWVNLNNISSKCNLTNSKDNVVYERNKIVNSKNSNYYVVYSLKCEKNKSSSESSDENFTRNKRKCKRQRLISESSNDTVVIDNENKNIFTPQSDIECVTLEDSDNASTISTNIVQPMNLDINTDFKKNTHEKIVNNIVSVCYKKYLKRLNSSGKNIKNYRNNDSFLQRKLLSMGVKTIHKDGFNQTGLLRYMEQKDLNVIWIPKLETNVSVRTTLIDNKQNDDELSLKSFSIIDNNYKAKDFVDIYDKIFTSEADSTNSNLIFPNESITQEVSSNETESVSVGSSNYTLINSSTESSQNKVKTGIILNTYEKIIKNNVLYLQAPKEMTNVFNTKKILNPSPVPNPKKLTKSHSEITNNSNKHDETTATHISSTENSSATDKCLCLPIITSTVSLAPVVKDLNTSNASPSTNEADAAPRAYEPTLPRIKVKPVSELMPVLPDKPKGAPVTANVWAGNASDAQPPEQSQPQPQPQLQPQPQPQSTSQPQLQLQRQSQPHPHSSSLSQPHQPPQHSTMLPNVMSNIILTQNPVYVSVMQPNNVTFPTFQTTQINNFNQATSKSVVTASQINDNRDYITMHTNELPRKKTHSPFLYFKELLQIYDMNLIDSVKSHMTCVIKFKLHFEQSGITPVTLCLSLFCQNNTFCIQVKDLHSKVLDVKNFTAYWQWEVLKGFRGDVVNTMLQNASRNSVEILQRTTCFVSLLSNITVITNI